MWIATAMISLALAEDIGRGDITTEATVPLEAAATAELLQKAPGVRAACAATIARAALCDRI